MSKTKTIIQFNNPQVQVSLATNIYTIAMLKKKKQRTEILPRVFNQLDIISLASLRRLAEALSK